MRCPVSAAYCECFRRTPTPPSRAHQDRGIHGSLSHAARSPPGEIFGDLNRARQVCKDSPPEGGGFEPSVPGAKEPVSFAEGEWRGIERGRPTKFVSLRGTDGSNPSPSSGESLANLTFGADPIGA